MVLWQGALLQYRMLAATINGQVFYLLLNDLSPLQDNVMDFAFPCFRISYIFQLLSLTGIFALVNCDLANDWPVVDHIVVAG